MQKYNNNNNNITAFVQIHPDHDWTHQVVHVYPTEVRLSMVYPIECEPASLKVVSRCQKTSSRGKRPVNLLSCTQTLSTCDRDQP
jgi:hypothetical protein